MLVLNPQDGARARIRNRMTHRFDYEHEHHFIEHEHEEYWDNWSASKKVQAQMLAF